MTWRTMEGGEASLWEGDGWGTWRQQPSASIAMEQHMEAQVYACIATPLHMGGGRWGREEVAILLGGGGEEHVNNICI